ncbi:protein ASYMMETRIC LEAVES 2 [Physcomitrium patens]|uniref:protein ASYMMETRIC LEAVES 2 n=1 Tax=Physcomitrium patens TaxID=3218 RepID=UPI000D15F200|nr:LOB domain-containing protein 6-like [Physcomitrium patens]|eukprot:XP_024358386.1 LOB domain-containing protein 6-like [Physcomitrella patens]
MHPYRRLRMVMASAPGTSACAACRVLRRKCTAQCLFAPYFPPDQPQKFSHVHKVFGVANVTKMLHDLPPPHREDCVNSLAYEADARVQDPVYGCVGAISILQQQVAQLQAHLALATSEISRLRETLAVAAAASTTSTTFSPPASNTALVTCGQALLVGLHQPPQSPPLAADDSQSAYLDRPASPIDPQHQETPTHQQPQPLAPSCEDSGPACS